MEKAKNISILALSFLLSFVFITNSFGQGAGGDIIQGTVSSATDGETLIGASVTEIDGNNRVISGTTTDVNGHYVLRVRNKNGRISVAYVGFEKEVIRINNRNTLNVT